MNEAWERAVEAALLDQTAPPSSSTAAIAPRVLTLDGAVKCPHGRLPPPALFERYQTLESLSIANVGVSSLEKFPKLRNLQRLSLSDNRIAGGLQFLVEAGLVSLRDLDLSNNRIQFVEDLEPLAQLRLVSLDLYECPVTRIEDYRARVFGMIRSLKYLDKLDVNENERAESEDEDDYEDEDEEEEDQGSGEVDGSDRVRKLVSGVEGGEGEVGVFNEDEESDAEEEAIELNGYYRSNGFRVAAGVRVDDVAVDEDEDEEDVEYDGVFDEDEDLGEEEIDEDDSDEEDVVEALDMGSSDADIDEVEVEGEDEDDDDGDAEDEEDEETENVGMSTDGEIDGHEQGEGDEDEDENGEIGEDDDHGIEEGGNEVQVGRDFDDDGEDEDEDGAEFLVQPVGRPVNENGGSDLDAGDNEDEDEDEVDDGAQDQDGNGDLRIPPSASHPNKRKRDEDSNTDDDGVEDLRSSRHH